MARPFGDVHRLPHPSPSLLRKVDTHRSSKVLSGSGERSSNDIVIAEEIDAVNLILKTTARTPRFIETTLVTPFIGSRISKHELSVDDLDICRDIIRCHITFDHHLSRGNSTATNPFHVQIELDDLQEEMWLDGSDGGSWKPVGRNHITKAGYSDPVVLNINDDNSPRVMGMKLINGRQRPLNPYIFSLNANDMGVYEWYAPELGSAQDPDPHNQWHP
ncbi:hypothetical protein BDZ89DRAFT_253385 [Hymenopellis radicata]|nr:hypothetical protein BDZ89DRAFT_253385 [Hymenopellis radicata]